ncbi:MAG: hypothetical protein ABI790_10190 [Betaproteobacteria bacterium]
MQTGVFNDRDDRDPMSNSAVLNITSLQNRDQRVRLISTIKNFADVPAPISADAVHRLVVFENSIYPVIQADKRWFFAAAGKTEAVQFARDMNVMHSVAAKTLESLVERRGEWTMGDTDPLLQRIVAFALYHHCAAIKWCFFRHEPVKPTIWPDLHALYKFADAQGFGFATNPVTLFADEAHYKITALSLYLRALMLEVLNTGSLSMAQIEIADGWLAEWTPEYALDETYSQRSHALYVDLELMAGMQLVTGNTAKPSYRYVRLEGLKDQVEAVRTQLRTGNPYFGRGAPNTFSMEEHVALLSTIERLYTTLLQASASRIEERKPVENLVAEVRLGFEDARMVVSGETAQAAPNPGALDASAPEGDAQHFGELELSLEMPRDPASSADVPATDTRWTRWKVHDMSSKGVGLMVDRVTGERISVGQLLAVRPDGFAHYLIGVIVRKLTQRTVGETLLGVEILSYRPLPVTLYRYSHARDAMPDAASPPVLAMYLPGRDQEGKSDILVLPSGDFGLKNIFSLPTKTINFRVRINRVLRKGSDWVGLRFEVIGKK